MYLNGKKILTVNKEVTVVTESKIDSISVNDVPQVIDQNKNVNITVPTKTSDLTNDSGFITLDSAFTEKEVESLPVSNISDKTIYKLISDDINYLYIKVIAYEDDTKTKIVQELNGYFVFSFENYEKDNIQYYHVAWGWPWESSESLYIKVEDLNYDTNNDIIVYMMDEGELVPSTNEHSYVRFYTTPPTNFFDDYTEQNLQKYQTWLSTAGKPINTGRYIYLDNNWVDFDKLIDKTTLDTDLNTTKNEILQQVSNNYIMLELQTTPSSTPITGTLTSEQLAILNRQTKIIFKFPRLDIFRNVLSFSMEIIDNNNQINYMFSVISLNGSRWDFSVNPSSGEWSLTNEYNYQQELVSGTNIKTINNESLLGSGDISIPTYSAGTGINITNGVISLDIANGDSEGF